MANTGNTQQQINYGSAANDGQGDPLRTAFIKTDDNFDAIWNAGPVGSNITIVNNTLQSNNVNGNIVLRPNGVGVIQANAAIVPNSTNLRDLGTADQRFRAAYIGTGGLSATGNVTANFFIGDGSLLTGVTGAYGNAEVADFLVSGFGNFVSNTIVTNGTIVASELDVANISHQFPLNITTNGGGPWQFAGNILRGPQGGSWTSAADTIFLNSPANGFITLQSLLLGNTVSELFMEHSFIRFFIDNGIDATWEMQADGRTAFPDYVFPYLDGNAGEVLKTDGAGNLAWAADTTDYGNANVLALGESGWSGNIIPSANGVYSLGNASNYWSNLFVASNTVFIGGVPLGIGAGNVLTVNGEALLSNDSNTSITTTGNITADNFIGNGSQLTDLSVAPGNLIENGDSNVAIAAPNGNVTVSANTATWNFGTDSVLTVPGNTVTSTLYTDNNGYRLNLEGNLNGVVTAKLVLDNDSGFIRLIVGNVSTPAIWAFRDNGNLTVAGNINFGGDASAGPSLNDFASITSAANFAIITDSANTDQTWTFDSTGNLTLPGNVSAAGNITGGNISTAGAVSATGNLSANNVSTGNVTATRVQNDANLEIRSNVAGTVKVWTFDAIGDLNLARNISGSGNINIGNVNLGGFLGDGNITSDGNITVKSGEFSVTFDNTGNITGTSANVTLVAGEFSATFDNTGLLTAPVVKTTAVLYSALPLANAVGAGARAFVTDGNTNVFASTVIGGAGNAVPVYSDGTDWRVG